MATIKSFSDLQQSKKLAEILPLESADMHYCLEQRDVASGYEIGITPYTKAKSFTGKCNIIDVQPAWGLAALISVLPDEITDDGDVYRNMFFHLKGKYIIQYTRLTTLWPSLLSVEADNPIDACVAMVEKLNELKLL